MGGRCLSAVLARLDRGHTYFGFRGFSEVRSLQAFQK
jgi:hypothetical protein